MSAFLQRLIVERIERTPPQWRIKTFKIQSEKFDIDIADNQQRSGQWI